MKRLFAAILILAMLMSFALADSIGDRMEVAHCNEWITLRADPSTKAESLARMPLGADNLILLDEDFDDFAQISYEGKIGYALKKYLEPVESFAGEEMQLTDEQRYNINLFLSNFSEQCFAMDIAHYNSEDADPAVVLDFAINHTWFNKQNLIETGDWDVFNTRLSSNKVAVTAKKYLNKAVKKGASQNFTLKGNHYYWEETGGHVKDGFTSFDSVQKLDEARISVYFHVYGSGEDWKNRVCYMQPEEIQQQYWCDAVGHAVINIGDGNLDDRGSWFLEKYTIKRVDV